MGRSDAAVGIAMILFPSEVHGYINDIRAIEYFGDLGGRNWQEVATEAWDEQVSDIAKAVDIDRVESVLEIGCGLGGLSANLAMRGVGRVYLLDGSKPVVAKVGFGSDRYAWSDVSVAELVVIENAPGAVVSGHTPETFPDERGIDLVVSMKSWGHHYPVDIYATKVANVLADDGLIVMDLRRGRRGIEAMKRFGFEVKSVLRESEKFTRVCLRRA